MKLFLFIGILIFAFTCLFAKVEYVELDEADFCGDFKEANWSKAFMAFLQHKGHRAKAEVACTGGRCDILTEDFAIEVDCAAKWHEAVGQACHYSLMLKKPAAIAIVNWESLSKDKLKALKRTASHRRIKAFFLSLRRELRD